MLAITQKTAEEMISENLKIRVEKTSERSLRLIVCFGDSPTYCLALTKEQAQQLALDLKRESEQIKYINQ